MRGNWKEFKNIYKGEKILLKIIVKHKLTGQECIDIPKEKENDSGIKALKVGMAVWYTSEKWFAPQVGEIVKIIDDRPTPGTVLEYIMPIHWRNMGDFRLMYPRRAYKTTFTKKFYEDTKEMKEENKARKEYREKPYFNVKLDTMKGTPDGKENLEKIKFPCWCVWRHKNSTQDHLGMLVTGFPNCELEYQLLDMGHQVDKDGCCSIDRNPNLEELIERWNIEIIKGESQCFKVGKFNV